MLGMGRKVDEKELWEHAENMIYILILFGLTK